MFELFYFIQNNILWFVNIAFACIGLLVMMTTSIIVSYRSVYMLLKSFRMIVVFNVSCVCLYIYVVESTYVTQWITY